MRSLDRQPLHLVRRHTIADADNRRLAQACGPLDENLRQIEASLGLSLQRRGASFRIQGPGPAVDRAVALIDALYERPVGPEQLALMLVGAQPVPQQPLVHADGPAKGGTGTKADTAAPGELVLHTRHSDLRGRTPNQLRYLQQMLSHDITFGIGPAGTGKTFLAVACAVDALERQGVQRIVLTRPAVEAGERLGFLPGDLAQKVDPYLRPLYDALYDLMGFDRVGKAFEKGQIEIAPLAFMRGRTLNHAFVILDEAQNTTREQMKMFLTRIGFGSKCVVTGDTSQVDLAKGVDSGLVDAQRVLVGVQGIAFTTFTAADVVRHPLVARIVDAYEQHSEPRR
jgi:phosphate starvation-inducible protein PhoH and related proteins